MKLRNNKTATAKVKTPEPENVKTFNVLVGVTGSVATVKLIELVKKLNSKFPLKSKLRNQSSQQDEEYNCDVKFKIVMTQNSQHFINKKKLLTELKDLKIDEQILTDADEWNGWKNMGDPVLHIELRKWADLFLIAPLDANTMAKMAHGICDNLLTCIVRAWDLSKPLVFCPAMNCHMYEHPLTMEHLRKLANFGYICIEPIEKRLACGDVGIGGMNTVETISQRVLEILTTGGDKTNHTQDSDVDSSQPGTCPSRSKDHNPTASSSNQITTTTTTTTSNNNRNNINIKSLLNSTYSKPNGTNSSPKLVININPESPVKQMNEFNNNEFTFNPQRQLGLTDYSCIPHNPNSLLARPKHIITYSKLDRKELKRPISTTNGCNPGDVEFPPDFDPTQLMEQSLITIEEPVKVIRATKLDDGEDGPIEGAEMLDDAIGDEPEDAKSQTMSEEHIRYLNTFNINSPVLNNAQFLALCNNKERSCFTCAICKHDYKNRKSMTRHFKEQHVQGCIFKCHSCNVAYKRREKLIKHNREFHSTTEETLSLGKTLSSPDKPS